MNFKKYKCQQWDTRWKDDGVAEFIDGLWTKRRLQCRRDWPFLNVNVLHAIRMTDKAWKSVSDLQYQTSEFQFEDYVTCDEGLVLLEH